MMAATIFELPATWKTNWERGAGLKYFVRISTSLVPFEASR